MRKMQSLSFTALSMQLTRERFRHGKLAFIRFLQNAYQTENVLQ